jgi:hypothetical protein
MAKQKEKPAEKLTAGIDKVVTAFNEAFEATEQSGGLVAQVCNTVKQIFKGDAITKVDEDYIVNEVAKRREWADSTERSGKSRVRTLCKVYARFVPAVEAYKRHKDAPRVFSWHIAMMLATAIKNEKSVADAIAVTIKKQGSGSGATKSLAQKLGMAVGIIKKIDSKSKDFNAFRDAFEKLCKKHSVNY